MLNRAMNKITFIMAAFALLIALMRQPLAPTASAQLAGTSVSTGSGSPSNCGASNIYTPGSIYIQSDNGHVWTCSGTTWTDDTAAASGVPSGFTGMITTGACPSGYAQVTALDAAMPEGTLAAHGDVGGTGGANSITPTVATLTAAAQAFTGSSATTSAVSAGTPAGTNATSTVTPVGTVAWPTAPTNVPTTAALTTGADSSTTGGVAKAIAQTPTIAWPTKVPTFAGSSSTVAAQTFTGSALATHTHTLTATGTNGTSSVTGTLNNFDNRPSFVKVIFCQKT